MLESLRLLAAVTLLAFGMAAAPAAAAPAGEVSVKELERLVETLQDDKDRGRLVGQLKAVIAAERRQAAEEGLLGELAEALSARLDDFRKQVVVTVVAISDAPRLLPWLERQVSDPAAREHWIEVIGKLLSLLVLGGLVQKGAEMLLRRPRRALGRRQAGLLARLPLLLADALFGLVPIALFAAAAYSYLPLLGITGSLRTAALMLVTAYIAAHASTVLAHAVLMPSNRGLRLLPIDDETANYLFIWARRLINVTIYGYVLAGAVVLLGLPKSGHTFLLKVLGLMVATMVVILVLQNRQTVARWLRSRGQAGEGRLHVLRNRLADIWHILAALYVGIIYAIWALNVKGGFTYVLEASALTVVILFVTALIGSWLRRLVDRGFAVSAELRAQFPGLEARANRYLPVLHYVLRVAVGFVTLLALLQAWGLDTFRWLTTGLGREVSGSVVTILLVCLLALLVWEVATSSIERYLAPKAANGAAIERSARARTLLPLLRNVLLIFLVVVVTLISLSELGVNIAPLLAGAGVVGLAIGFGSQKLVQDLITGAFILFENTIAVGDVVRLGEHSGLVEAISIRTIRLRDFSGAVHTIPFSSVTTIVNMTKDYSFAVFDIGVGYREDTDRVVEVLREIGAELRTDGELGRHVLEPLEVVGVDRFADSAVIIKARLKTQPIRQWAVQREFNRRLKRRFDELGIEIPFPQTTLHLSREAQGALAASAPVAVPAMEPA